MRQTIGLIMMGLLGLMMLAPAIVDATPDARSSMLFDGGTPPNIGANKAPTTIDEGVKEVGNLIGFVKAKLWWAVAGASVFIVMLILQLTGVFDKIGKRWTWILAGALSVIAALCFAFNEQGFSWSTFLTFCTAGPTVAWLRGFVKKAVMPDKKQE